MLTKLWGKAFKASWHGWPRNYVNFYFLRCKTTQVLHNIIYQFLSRECFFSWQVTQLVRPLNHWGHRRGPATCQLRRILSKHLVVSLWLGKLPSCLKSASCKPPTPSPYSSDLLISYVVPIYYFQHWLID